LEDVHFIEMYLQQKTVGRTGGETNVLVQSGGVH